MGQRIFFRRALITLLIVMSLTAAAVVGAAVEIFDGAGKYIMSDFENHDIAKQRAQQRAEKDAQKKAGIALKRFSRSINSELTDEEVSAVTNNIIKVSDVKIKPVPFEANGVAGIMYEATLKATIDTDGIYAWLKRDDKEKVTIIEQNTQLQDAIQKNDKLAENLQEQYNRATSQAEKDRIRKQMTDADRDFLANQKFEEALKLAYAKDYQGAIKLYDEVLDFGEYYEVYYNRANVYMLLEQYERAIQDYDKAIQLNPNYADAYNNRGIIHTTFMDFKSAIVDFTKAIVLDPNNSIAYYNRGRAYKDLGQYERAIQDLDKAIELDPNYGDAYGLRGAIYFIFIGDQEKAQADFDKADQLENKY